MKPSWLLPFLLINMATSLQPSALPNVIDERINLPNGIRAQVVHASPDSSTNLPPIVFFHGLWWSS